MITINEVTDIGSTRERNEDNYVYIRCSLNDQELVLASICDGMGGLDDGAYASREVCESLKRCVYSKTFESILDLRRSILAHIKEANRTIYKSKTQYGRQCGTTVTATLTTKDKTYVWHVGDSRLIQVTKDGSVDVLTKDQTYVARLVREGKITPSEARVHPKRSSLTNAIGVFNDVTVDMFEFDHRGSMIVLASDGFYNGLSDQDYVTLYNGDTSLNVLKDKVIHRGETDNVTALTLKVN